MATHSSSINSASKELTSNDLPVLCNALNDVAPKCFELGLQLGVKKANIDIIMKNNKDDCEAQLREIISERLKQNPPLTWHNIITALRSPAVGEYSLASQISSQIKCDHIHYRQPSTSVVPQVGSLSSLMSDQHLLVVRAYGENCQSPVGGPPHGENFQSSTQMKGHTPLKEPPSTKNYPLMGQKQTRELPHEKPHTQMKTLMPVRGALCRQFPPQRGHLHVRRAQHEKNYQPPTQMKSLIPVRRAPYRKNYQLHTQRGQLPARGPPHVENYQWSDIHSQTSHAQSQRNSNVKSYLPPAGRPSNLELPHKEGSQRANFRSPSSTLLATTTQTPSKYNTHKVKHTSYIKVVNQHSDILTETICGDLTFFINKFIELGFVTRTATDDVLSQHGVGNGEKAGQLLSLLTACYNRTHNKEKWFDEFIGVFSSEPAYENLADRMTVALEKMRWSDFGSSVTEPLPQLEKSSLFRSPMDAFVHYIKVCYKQCEIERNLDVLKWPPTPSKIFINLACIDWESVMSKEEADEYTRAMVEDGNIDVIMKKKTNIYFSDIARDLPASNSSKRLVLVEGAPGVGKSTFAWEFCRRWERGEIAQQYQLVLLLRLRDEKMSRAKSLKDLIYHPSDHTCHNFAVDLVDCLGVHTLIILEGFDELPDLQRKKPSIFLQLILGQLLPLATILVTSRPWATGSLLVKIKHRIFQHVEILGFTKENITKYVTSVFTGEGKKTASAIDQSVGDPDEVSEEAKKNINDVMAYIGKYPQIKACMYIPLNAAIVVSIYRESMKSKWVLPTTLTELYQALTRILLLRYLHGHAEYSHRKWSVESFEDLPREVYSQLLMISKTAYDGVCRDDGESVQLIFSKIPDDFETLGLMQSVSQLFIDGQKTSHNFLHLTFQEFLAAFFISTMLPAEQLKHFQRHKDGRLRVVLKFLAGLTKLNKVTPDELRSLLGEPTVEQSEKHKTPYCNPMRPDVCVSPHHTNWLFEAQNCELLQSLFHNHTVSFTFIRGMLPLEYYSVGYCIAHSHSKWSLIFNEDTEVHMLVSGAKTGYGNYRVALKTTSMRSENMHILMHGFSSSLEELYYLKIPDNGNSQSLPHFSILRILELHIDNNKSAFNISCDLSFSPLEALIISSSCKGTTLGDKTCKAIGKLLSSTTSLKEFHLSSNYEKNPHVSIRHCEYNPHVNDKDMKVSTESVSDNIVKGLDIDCKCTFTTTTTRSLAPFIASGRSTTLQYLKIDIEEVDIFTKSLSDNVALPLKSLDINCKCTLTTTGARSLVQFITRSSTLQYVKIHIDMLEDVDIFAKRLSDNIAPALKSLDIDFMSTFTTTATRSLVQFITKSTTLQYIRICHVTFCAQGLKELTEAIHHCSRLQEKKLEELTFHVECSEDVGHLRHMIKDHPDMLKSITDWKGVTNSSIQHDVEIKASLLCFGLGCSQDTSLFLNGNINDVGAQVLALALHPNSTLKKLYLSNNDISDSGAVALAQALEHNFTLEWLYLSNNSIRDSGAIALAQVLYYNSTLERLYLDGNNAIGKEGTNQLVQALTVNTSITRTYPYYGGLGLPKGCKKYATQCTQYNAVKDRMHFL